MNTTIVLNFIRSAKAPQIRAGVMTKNIPWNSMCGKGADFQARIALVNRNHRLAVVSPDPLRLGIPQEQVAGIADPAVRVIVLQPPKANV